MNRTIAYCTLACLATVLICTSLISTNVLSDENEFLKGFVNHEFINVLGVILAIMLPATATIHFAFNNIEERHNSPGALDASRKELQKAVNWLVVLFISGVLIAILKPIFCHGEVMVALANSAALLILAWMALILHSLSILVFEIKPVFK